MARAGSRDNDLDEKVARCWFPGPLRAALKPQSIAFPFPLPPVPAEMAEEIYHDRWTVVRPHMAIQSIQAANRLATFVQRVIRARIVGEFSRASLFSRLHAFWPIVG